MWAPWKDPRSVLPLPASFCERQVRQTADPQSILAGSVAQKINRETVVLLGWGRAILLQLAHPLVAAGIADYSAFRTDLRGYALRVRRTVGAMLAFTFGTDEDVRVIASRINAVHTCVRGTLRETAGVFPAGTRYSAHDPELLRWVHATMLDSLPLAYELFVAPLTREEKDRYCAEASAMAPFVGIRDGLLPCNYAELERYMESMFASGQIHVTQSARMLARGVLFPRLGPAATPFFFLVRLITIGLLPPAIREAYEFPWDAHDERTFRRCVALLRQVRSLLPAILCEWPVARGAALRRGRAALQPSGSSRANLDRRQAASSKCASGATKRARKAARRR